MLLLLAVVLPACGPAEASNGQDGAARDDGAAASEEAAPRERVRAESVVRDTIVQALDAVANVESQDVVDVLPERAEPVREILVEEGDRVEQGDVLARLRSVIAELAVKEAEVRVAEAENEVERARKDAARNRQLATRPDGTSLLSERELENSEQALLAAQTALQAAQVALGQAQLDLDRCTLTAPIAGTVTARDVSLGDQTVIGQRAFQIADLDHPRVVFYRPQSELGQLRVGQRLIATAEAFPGTEIPGAIERIAPVVDADSGTVKVTARLEPPEGLRVPNGLLVRLRLVLEAHEDALLVPKRALIYEEDGVACFAVRDGRAVRIELEPGFENPTQLEHRGAGLTDQDVVVVVGQDRLDDGEAVEVLPE